MMIQTRSNHIKIGGSRPGPIVVRLAEIAARLDVIFATLKDDVEAIKTRMYGTPFRCHEYEAIPITSKVLTPGDHDCLHKGDHIRSNMDIEVGGNSLTGDEVMGDACNCEDTDDDGKDTVTEDNTMAKTKANQNNNLSKDQHETMDDVVSEKLQSLQFLIMILLKETIEGRLAEFNPKRLEKIGLFGRDSNLIMEQQSRVESDKIRDWYFGQQVEYT